MNRYVITLSTGVSHTILSSCSDIIELMIALQNNRESFIIFKVCIEGSTVSIGFKVDSIISISIK